MPFLGLNAAARWLYRQDRRAVAVAFYLAGVSLLPLVPADLVPRNRLVGRPNGRARSNLEWRGLSNRQLQITILIACLWSGWLALRTRTGALSTVFTLLSFLFALAVLGDFGLMTWLDDGRYDRLAWHLAPIVPLYAAGGYALDRRGQAWFARPLFVASGVSLVAVLDLLALDGTHAPRPGRLAGPSAVTRPSTNPVLIDTLAALSLNGVLFYLVAWLVERAGSDATAPAAQLLFTIAPFSILEPLAYLSETAQYSPRVDWLYLGLAIGIALVSHQRQRTQLLLRGRREHRRRALLHRRSSTVVRQTGVGRRAGDRRTRGARRRLSARHQTAQAAMKIVIAGGSGFLGRALTTRLEADGHDVVVLTRRPAASSGRVRRVVWQPDGTAPPPEAGQPTGWARELEDADAVVNLAGEGIADRRWTASRKRALLESRVHSTRSLVAAIRAASRRPRTFVQASGVGYYGVAGDDVIDESSPPGSDFLAGLCMNWEAEARAVEALGCRLVIVRNGIVLARHGGALKKMLPPFLFFVGGPIADGRQYFSWMAIDDWTALVAWALATTSVSGALNGTAPEPVTNAQFSQALGRALHRPSWIPVPGFALRAAGRRARRRGTHHRSARRAEARALARLHLQIPEYRRGARPGRPARRLTRPAARRRDRRAAPDEPACSTRARR